jgi:hypothetical protein
MCGGKAILKDRGRSKEVGNALKVNKVAWFQGMGREMRKHFLLMEENILSNTSKGANLEEPIWDGKSNLCSFKTGEN